MPFSNSKKHFLILSRKYNRSQPTKLLYGQPHARRVIQVERRVKHMNNKRQMQRIRAGDQNTKIFRCNNCS